MDNKLSKRNHATGFGAAVLVLAFLSGGVSSAQIATPEPEYTGSDRVEEWVGKTILVVTPHPDDETFTSGGTLAKLAANGNDIRIVIYTTRDHLGVGPARRPSRDMLRRGGARLGHDRADGRAARAALQRG